MINSLREVNIKGIQFKVYDSLGSFSVPSIERELKQDYFLDIDFKDGDIVLDIGGHVGMFSIYLALKYPNIKIYTFEPTHNNFSNLKANIELNNIKNVILNKLAVTGDGRKVNLGFNSNNSGGSTMFKQTDYNNEVNSITLKGILDEYEIEKCKLIKIDCEGAEYEILAGVDVGKITEYITGEFHDNDNFRKSGHRTEDLIRHCKDTLEDNKIKITELHNFI